MVSDILIIGEKKMGIQGPAYLSVVGRIIIRV